MKKGLLLTSAVFVMISLLLMSGMALVTTDEKGVENETMDNSSLTASDYPVKTKTAYFHNKSGTVNNVNNVLTMNTTRGEDQNITEWDKSTLLSYNWYLDPPFAGDFSLDGDSEVYIWMTQKDATGETNWATFYLTLYEIDPNGDVNWTSDTHTKTYNNVRTTLNEYSISGEFNHTIPADHSLRCQIQIESNNQVSTRIAFGDSEFPSRLEMDTNTYVHPTSVRTFNYTHDETDVFPLDENNKTIYFNSTVVDPFGGYDIWAVNITILDNEGNVVNSTYREPMTKIKGNSTTYINNYTFEWNYSDLESGEYKAVISAVDNTGYYYRFPEHPGDETYGGHLESLEKKFWIGGKPYFVNFKTIDDMDMALEGAEIVIEGTPKEQKTNSSGLANFTLYPDTYTVKVYWQDIVVNTTQYDVSDNVTVDEAVNLSCEVYYPTYHVIDANSDDVSDANLYLSHPNGSLVQVTTRSDGRVEVPRLPGGVYDISTYWRGREVNQTSQILDDNSTFEIQGRIYGLDVVTKDNQGNLVSNVQVTIEFNDTKLIADAKLTDNLGEMNTRLPGTEPGFVYNVRCEWHGVSVGNVTEVELTGNRNMEIILDIYMVDFFTEDNANKVLGNVSLEGYTEQTGALANTAESNDIGYAQMRLPRGEHRIEAYWKGIPVNTTHIDVVEGLSVTLDCSVYHLTFETEDNRTNSLPNAKVTISHPDAGILDSNTTDQNGIIKTRLPGAQVDIDVSWKGVNVYSDTSDIQSGGSETLDCDVYYLQIEAVDDEEETLEDANVQFKIGDRVLQSKNTQYNGMTPEVRLPAADYTIEAHWKGIQVYSEPYTLDSYDIHTIKVAVYHVEMKVTDDMGEKISGARVEVTHDDSLITYGITDEDGIVFARIPRETHTFTVEWRNVMIYESEEEITQSGTLTLNSQDVYHVNFRLADSKDIEVKNASVTLKVNGVQFSSGTSDENGMYFERIPTPVGEPGDIKVIVDWRGVEVYNDKISIDGNHLQDDPKEVELSIYYVQTTLVDERGNVIKNAKLIDRHSELPEEEQIISDVTSDEEGKALLRLPRGNQTITTTWKDITVDTNTLNLAENKNLTIHCDVYYLDIQVKDDKGKPLPHSSMMITYEGSDKLYQSNYTDAQGSIEVRIPAATWDIQASWFDTVVFEETYNVTDEESSWTLERKIDVYYLTVMTKDKDGEKLSDVYVNIEGGGNKWSGYTSKGNITFRLPARGDYNVTAEFKSTYLMTNVDLDENKQVALQQSSEQEVKFDSYPTPFYRTNLFYLLAAFLVIITILYLLYNKVGPEVEVDEEFEEEEFEEEDSWMEEEEELEGEEELEEEMAGDEEIEEEMASDEEFEEESDTSDEEIE